MRKRQVFGWILFLIGSLFLLFSILRDHHVYLGVFNSIYRFLDWFSLGAFFELVFESFESVFKFIKDYFWYLFLIALGITLAFSAKNRNEHEDGMYSDSGNYKRHYEDDGERKKFCRNLDDMKLAGVCSGFAYLLQVDPTIVRIIVLFAGLMTSGTIIFAYILLAILLPGEHLG